MIIDGHSHVTLPIQEHIIAMDAAKVDKTVLFSTTFHPEAAKITKHIKIPPFILAPQRRAPRCGYGPRP